MAPFSPFLQFWTTLGSKTQLFVQNAPGLCFVGPREAIFGDFEPESEKVVENAGKALKVLFGPRNGFWDQKLAKCTFCVFAIFDLWSLHLGLL